MDLDARIRKAMEQAPAPGPSGPPIQLVYEAGPAAIVGGHSWSELGDYDAVSVNPGHCEALNAVEVRTPAEFLALLAGAVRHCRLPISQGRLLQIARHEEHHAKVWDALKVSNYVYGLAFVKKVTDPLKPWGVFPYVLAQNVEVPKLAFAATYYIEDASTEDVDMLRRQFGYKPRSLRRKLLAHNEAGRQPFIPVPRRGFPLRWLAR